MFRCPKYACKARVSWPALARAKPQAWRSMCGWALNGSLAAAPTRSTSLAKPAVAKGAPRSLPPSIETLRRLLHQLRAGREVPIGVAHAGVSEIGGKHRELLLDVPTLPIPAEQGPDGEPMPEVVHARENRPARIRCAAA
jgi:hypothetical protein